MKSWIHIVLGLVAAIAIILTAWLAKGTAHENAWIYIIAIWALVSGGLELYFGIQRRGKCE